MSEITHTQARETLQEHMDWILAGCPAKGDMRAYRDRIEQALLQVQELEIKDPVIKKLDLDPKGELDDIAEFFTEEFSGNQDEYHRYIGILGDMWRENWQYSAFNPELKDTVEKELRHHAEHIATEYRAVTTFSVIGYNSTEIEWIGSFSNEMLAMLAEQEDWPDDEEVA